MLAYVKKNIDNPRDRWVKQFVEKQGHNPMLIEVPDEYKDLEPEADDHKTGFGRVIKKRKVQKRVRFEEKCKYDAWRCMDREQLIPDGKHHGVATITCAPADLIHLFGLPDCTTIGYQGSG